MSATMKEAVVAKEAIKALLRTAGVVAACGITKTPSGELAVKVNLANASDAGAVPTDARGVPVLVEKVGKVRALAGA